MIFSSRVIRNRPTPLMFVSRVWLKSLKSSRGAYSFRNKYAPRLDFSDFSQSRLTNISGVGLFLITRDEKIIVSRHSSNVQVYSDVWTYSASGSMDWSEDVHPFVEAARETFEEIGHRTSLDNTYLFGFGIDANNLVCQF